MSLAFSKFVESDLPHEAVVPDLPYALVMTASTDLSLDRAQEHVINTRLGLGRLLTNSERLFEAFRTVYCTLVFPKIQLRQVQQGNGLLMSTATGQRVRPQLSVCDRTVSSAPAYHDHDVFAREEPVHAVVQATVQRVVIRGFQNGIVTFGFRPMCFLKLLSLSGSSNFLQSIVHIERPSHIPGQLSLKLRTNLS